MPREPKGLRTLVVLESAVREARGMLNDGQYWHVADIVKRLVWFGSPEQLADLRIAPIEGFHELKLKGHLLGKINLRIYFADLSAQNEIVVLKTYKKEEEHQVGRHIILNLEDRFEDYLRSSVSRHSIVFRP